MTMELNENLYSNPIIIYDTLFKRFLIILVWKALPKTTSQYVSSMKFRHRSLSAIKQSLSLFLAIPFLVVLFFFLFSSSFSCISPSWKSAERQTLYFFLVQFSFFFFSISNLRGTSNSALFFFFPGEFSIVLLFGF